MIEINKKTDILNPFNKIGERDWEINTRKILKSFAYNYGDEMKKEISDNEIEKLENRLGVALPTELKQFYKKFGVADIGENLQELNEIDWLKNLWEEGYGPEFSEEEEEILPYLITFSDYLGNGNMFCFHSETKHIYYYDHDTFPLLYKIFDNVSIYIQCCLIFAQVELLGGVEEDEIMEWTEDIVTDLIGYHKVKKWRY